MHTEWFGDALSGIPILKVGICKEKKKKKLKILKVSREPRASRGVSVAGCWE